MSSEKLKTRKDVYMYTLGAMIVLGILAIVIILINVEIPDKNAQALNLIIGALIGSFTSVVQYFFGSSKGSADKNEIIANTQKPTA